MAFETPRTVVASAARTTTGNSGQIGAAGVGDTLSLLVNVTAVGGTPSMTLTVEWSHDGTTFAPADPADTHGAAITGVLARMKAYAVKAPFYRIVWTITGTSPSLTFSITDYVS